MDDWKFERLLKTFSEHDSWEAPPPGKVVQLNDPGQLWFSYPWTFYDALEGSLPESNQYPEVYCDKLAAKLKLSPEIAERQKQEFLSTDTKSLRECLLSMAQICGVTCWHANTVESLDMWLFVEERNGVAVRSTIGQLESALNTAHNSPRKKACPKVCSVEYVDHYSHFLPEDGFLNLLAIVQSDHSYEDEVRFVAKSPDLAKMPMTITHRISDNPTEWHQAFTPLSKKEREDYIRDCGSRCADAYARIRRDNQEGFNLPINLDGLIDEIVLKAGCTLDYERSVKDALRNAGLSGIHIRASQL